ncbi:MAG: MarR family winged helix-turn-helix transcriptional regulator [Novosphingobium sp.]|jgi:DNA-binding MarR family transcriptional regulator|nr:MarR family transcriptional regulator [Novosphingobium sp.]
MSDPLAYLLSDAARLLRRAFDARMRAMGVTGPQARLLLVLGLHEGENQGFYADRLDVEAITLCRMLDRMEDAALIERRRDPADRRAWRVHLTPAGRDLLPRLREGVAPMVEAMLTDLSEDDRARLGAMLELVRGNLARSLEPEVVAHG